jgi:serine/threonine protein kinase
MGEVYRATDSSLGRVVAVKVLAERHSRDPDVRARFTREALAAARLSGEPYVVTVFDVGEHNGRPFIVMEYVEGGTVHDRLRSERVPAELSLDWLEQAGEALDAAHRHGVVHRDVKPANLLLDRDDVVRVSDFGVASAAGLDTLTLPGTVIGTAGYLAPEQARGEQATPASDRYALAVVAFELLTGRRPFAADTPVTEALGHLNAAIPSATEIAPELPAGVDTVFARALAKDEDRRPATAADLVKQLRATFDSSTVPTLVSRQPGSIRIHGRSRRRARNAAFAVAGAGLVLGGLAVAALVGVGGDDGSGRTVRTVTHVRTVVSTTTTQTTPSPAEDGATLDEEGFALMQAGDYRGALPLLERAVRALAGLGSLDEAYASYNLAYTRFALGRCDGVLDLLDRSESVQGKRGAIDKLRHDAERVCLEGEPGEGKGNGQGNKKDRGGD